jgi:hypothetical protein
MPVVVQKPATVPSAKKKSLLPPRPQEGNGHVEPVDLAALGKQLDSLEAQLCACSLDVIWGLADGILTFYQTCQRLKVIFKDAVEKYVKRFKYKRALHYLQFRRTFITRHDLPDEQMWATWQEISGNKPKELTPAGKPKKPKPGPNPNGERQIQFPPGPITDEASERAHYQRMDDLKKLFSDKLGGEIIVLAVERLHEQECGDAEIR